MHPLRWSSLLSCDTYDTAVYDNNNNNKTVCHQCQAPYVELTEYKLTERLVLDLVLELALDLVLELALDLVLDLDLDLDLDFWNISEAFKPF